jgi:hypothetical protein
MSISVNPQRKLLVEEGRLINLAEDGSLPRFARLVNRVID